jgi:hypothetical protein
MARQHVISEFYLRNFRPDTKGTPLTAWNKREQRFEKRSPASFMAPEDDHSREIEHALGRVESAAAPAIRRLIDRARSLPPGLCTLSGDQDPDEQPSAEFTDGVQFEGVKMHVVGRRLALPSTADRSAMAAFLTVSYSRAPNTEAAVVEIARAVEAGLLWAAGRLQARPGLLKDARETLDDMRWFGLRNAGDIADRLHQFQWWVVKTTPEDGLVVGDSPAVAGLAVGEEGGWYPLLGEDTMLIAMPLAPNLALLISRHVILAGRDEPGDELPNIVRWLNRRSWLWAKDYVFARDRATLERVMNDLRTAPAESTAPAIDVQYWFRRGVTAVATALTTAQIVVHRRSMRHRMVRCHWGEPMAHELVPAIRPIEI